MPRPILLLDVGFAATGVARATLHDDGPHVELAVLVPSAGLSPKALREKRAATRFGDLAERLFGLLLMQLTAHLVRCGGDAAHVVAEVPVLGARSAGAMRSMALALACWRAACDATRSPRLVRHEFVRSDVLAACGLAGRKHDDTQKVATEALVRRCCKVDEACLPPVRTTPATKRRPAGPCREDLERRWDAFDAAALLFAAREGGVLRTAGWGDGVLGGAR